MDDVLVYSAIQAAKAVNEAPEKFNKRLERGEVPAYRVGKGWKIPKTLLQAYVEGKAVKEANERKALYEEMQKTQD